MVESLSFESPWLVVFKADSIIFCTVLAPGAIAYLRIIRTPELVLGRNYASILTGICLPTAFIWSNHVALLFGVTWWPFDFFGYSTEPAIIFGWSLMAWGMWTEDPPRCIDTGGRGEGDLNNDLERISRSLKGITNRA